MCRCIMHYLVLVPGTWYLVPGTYIPGIIRYKLLVVRGVQFTVLTKHSTSSGAETEQLLLVSYMSYSVFVDIVYQYSD
jgi:hypothetical protein